MPESQFADLFLSQQQYRGSDCTYTVIAGSQCDSYNGDPASEDIKLKSSRLRDRQPRISPGNTLYSVGLVSRHVAQLMRSNGRYVPCTVNRMPGYGPIDKPRISPPESRVQETLKTELHGALKPIRTEIGKINESLRESKLSGKGDKTRLYESFGELFSIHINVMSIMKASNKKAVGSAVEIFKERIEKDRENTTSTLPEGHAYCLS